MDVILNNPTYASELRRLAAQSHSYFQSCIRETKLKTLDVRDRILMPHWCQNSLTSAEMAIVVEVRELMRCGRKHVALVVEPPFTFANPTVIRAIRPVLSRTFVFRTGNEYVEATHDNYVELRKRGCAS